MKKIILFVFLSIVNISFINAQILKVYKGSATTPIFEVVDADSVVVGGDGWCIHPAPKDADVPADAIHVYEAVDICNQLESGVLTTDTYHVKGWVCAIDPKNAEAILNYGNAVFYIADSYPLSAKKQPRFYAYQVYGKGGKRLMDPCQVEPGDYVVIEGKICNYNGQAETQGQGSAFIYSSTNVNFDPADPEPTPAPDYVNVPQGTLNVYEAIALGTEIGAGNKTSEAHYVMGYVRKVEDRFDPQYGNYTFYIAANKEGMVTELFEAYQVLGKNGNKITNADAVKEGDFVILYGKISNYHGTIETVRGSYIYYSNNPNF